MVRYFPSEDRSEWGCEPRPRVVPSDPPLPGDAPRDLYGLPVTPYGMVHLPQLEPDLGCGSLGHMWLRGIGYDALRSELADGYYPDDTLNP